VKADIERAFDRFVSERSSCALLVRRLDREGTEHAHRAAEVMPGASLLKVPVVMAVYEAALRNELDLAERIPLDALGATRHASTLAALRHEPDLSLRSLCGLAIVASDNRCADYLLRRVGFEAVTACLQAHGCVDSRMAVGFQDADLGTRGRGNVTTAADALTIVTAAACRPRYSELAAFLLASQQRDRIPLRIPSGVPVAHKTGTLFQVANDVGVIFGPELTLGVAVLTDGEPDVSVTGPAIGDFVGRIWRAHGQPVAW
jgi:beta-lactamase class A